MRKRYLRCVTVTKGLSVGKESGKDIVSCVRPLSRFRLFKDKFQMAVSDLGFMKDQTILGR